MKRTLLNSILKLVENTNIGKNNASNLNNWVKNELESIEKGLTILDVGAGTAQHKKHCSHLNYKSHDFAKYNSDGDGKGLQKSNLEYVDLDYVSDITNLDINDESIDVILCTEVLEHIPDPISAINEMKRVLKIGGKIILTTPFNSVTHWSPFFFYPGFSPNFFEHYLKDNFSIKKLNLSGDYFSYVSQELRRLQSVNYKYSKINTSFLFEIALRYVLRILNKMMLKDSGSEELLAYGVFVTATRIS